MHRREQASVTAKVTVRVRTPRLEAPPPDGRLTGNSRASLSWNCSVRRVMPLPLGQRHLAGLIVQRPVQKPFLCPGQHKFLLEFLFRRLELHKELPVLVVVLPEALPGDVRPWRSMASIKARRASTSNPRLSM